MNINEKPELKNDTLRGLDIYNEFIEILKGIDGLELDTTQKMSIAWLIEREIKKSPEKWSSEIVEIENKIKELGEKSGKVGITQFLSREIKEKYMDDLKKEVLSEIDDDRKKALNAMIKMVAWQLERLKKREEANEATSFGGISIDRIPDWFPKE